MRQFFRWVLAVICFLSWEACSPGSDISVYETRDNELLEKYIFREGSDFFTANLAEGSRIREIDAQKLLVDDTLVFRMMRDLSTRMNGPFRLEASFRGQDRESGFDLKLTGKVLMVREIKKGEPPVCYMAEPDNGVRDLLKKAANYTIQRKRNRGPETDTANTLRLRLYMNGRRYARFNKIYDDDITLMYESLRFALERKTKWPDVRMIPDTLR